MHRISTNNTNKWLFALILLLTQTLLLVHASIHHSIYHNDQHSDGDEHCELCMAADHIGHGLALGVSAWVFSTFSLALENTVFVPQLFAFIASSPLPRAPPLV